MAEDDGIPLEVTGGTPREGLWVSIWRGQECHYRGDRSIPKEGLWRGQGCPYGGDRGVTSEGLGVSVGRGQGSPYRGDRAIPTEGTGVSL